MDISERYPRHTEEEIIEILYPSWGHWRISGWIIIGSVLWLLSIFSDSSVLFLGGTAIFCLFFVYSYKVRQNSLYVVTDMRILKSFGWLHEEDKEIFIDDINGIDISQAWSEKMSKYGHIKFYTPNGEVELQAVPTVQNIVDVIEERRDMSR